MLSWLDGCWMIKAMMKFVRAILFFSIAAAIAFWAINNFLPVKVPEEPVSVRQFAASGSEKHPAVVILHGYSGFDHAPQAYEKYGRLLASKGIDAYLVTYYTASDVAVVQAKRGFDLTERLPVWTDRISGVVADVLRNPRTSGKVGILGFSLGGTVGVAVAAGDPRISALVVFYGTKPDAVTGNLPPLLELHGDSDQIVPAKDGLSLVRWAQGHGGDAEQVTYNGEGHVFDWSPGNSSDDAHRRAIDFLVAHLAKGKEAH